MVDGKTTCAGSPKELGSEPTGWWSWVRKTGSFLNFVFGSVVGAAVVGLFAHNIERGHNEAITRVTDQITKLYQPFYEASIENDLAWCAFAEGTWTASNPVKPGCNGGRAYWTGPTAPDADVVRWRAWMRSTFQPLNESMERIINDNRGLLIPGDLPPRWTAFLRHVTAYRGLIGEWRDGDQQERHTSFVQKDVNVPIAQLWPKGMTKCALALKNLLEAELRHLRRSVFRTETTGQERTVPWECN